MLCQYRLSHGLCYKNAAEKHLAQTWAEEVMMIASDRLFGLNEMAYVKFTGTQ